jgi:isoquinoline 1-oxidoreductase beta subunit
MSVQPSLSRRDFLRVVTAAGTGLVIAVTLPGCQNEPTPPPAATFPPTATSTATGIPAATTAVSSATAESTPTGEPAAAEEPTATPDPNARFAPNLYLRVDGTGAVTITVPRPEMGQGVRTALAMIIAEELDADWSTVRVEQAPADRSFGNQVVGGSRSILESYVPLRQAGATARSMLILAAADRWGVEVESCRTERGWVIHEPSGRELSYADLAEAAAALPLPARVPTKELQDFTIIGRPLGRLDNPDIVTGRAIYGTDVVLPEMLYATIARPPIFGATADSYDDTAALAVTGVRHVVPISSGIAVVADGTWAAIQGRQALEITWDEGPRVGLNSGEIRQRLTDRLPSTSGEEDPNTLEAIYEIPFLAHATLEPMNCTAHIRADSGLVWAPTQDPNAARTQARRVSRLSEEAVQVHVPLIGGGFGRRLQVDYVAEAVEISQAVGAPVKVQWTREDDIQHDFYHPFSLHHASTDLDDLRLPRVRSQESGDIPTGAWRSVYNFTNAFVQESFIDEMAAALGRDPYELRLDLEPRSLHAVLEVAASRAGWGDPLPAGWGRGIACWSTFNVTPVAHVVELSVAESGAVRVHRVVCAVDPGTVINPNMVMEQMEGGIVFGLTAALKADITVANGRVQQSNFHDYALLRMDEMPEIEVYILPSDAQPSGVGEMGVPPTAPAVANAIFAATGKRLRKLPIRPEDISAA